MNKGGTLQLRDGPVPGLLHLLFRRANRQRAERSQTAFRSAGLAPGTSVPQPGRPCAVRPSSGDSTAGAWKCNRFIHHPGGQSGQPSSGAEFPNSLLL